MNQVAKIEDTLNKSVSDSITVGTGGITFENAGEVMEYAKMMAVSGSAVPKHLRGQPGACLGIIDDAIRFQCSPYSLARKSYFVNDNLAYEAQVIAGIINRFAPLTEIPLVEYEGEDEGRVCVVTGKFNAGYERIYRSPKFSKIYPKNSPLWKTDPDQQHAYYSLRAFARRYCPEIILGMYDIEELKANATFNNARDVTPGSMNDRYRPSEPDALTEAKDNQPADETPDENTQDGFNEDHVDEEINSLDSTDSMSPESDGTEGEDEVAESSSSPQPLTAEETDLVIRYLKSCVAILDVDAKNLEKFDKYNSEYKRLMDTKLAGLSDNGKAVCQRMKENFQKVLDGSQERETTISFYNEMLGTDLA